MLDKRRAMRNDTSMRTAHYTGKSRPAHRRADRTLVPRLGFGDVVLVLEVRGSTSIVTKGDKTFGFRHIVKNDKLN